VFNNGGTVDKFMGDARYYFGAPEEHVQRASMMMIATAVGAPPLKSPTASAGFPGWDQWNKPKARPFSFCCGIHQGTV